MLNNITAKAATLLNTNKGATTPEPDGKINTAGVNLFKRNFGFDFYAFILILLVGVLSYSNALQGAFVYDDIPNIIEHKPIHLDSFSLSKLAKIGLGGGEDGPHLATQRPIARISFALNYYFGKLNPFGYHLVNLVIHLLTASLVYLFLKFTLNLPSLRERYGKFSTEASLLTSLLFVAHPVQTQAVNYLSQRVAIMATLFFLLAFYCYGKARMAMGKKRIAFFAVSALATLLALGSKENALTLPFFIALYEYYFFQELDLGDAKKKWLYTISSLFLVIAVLGLAYTNFAPGDWLDKQFQMHPFTSGQRMLTQLRVVVFYISLLFLPLPSRLNVEHNVYLSYSFLDPPTTLACFFLILGLIAGSIYLAKKRPLISFALIWFWGNLVLESSFLPLNLIYEHRLYLPSVGFFLLISIFLLKGIERLNTQVWAKQGIKVGVLLVLIVCLSALSYQRNKVWHTKVTFWKDMVNKLPKDFTPYTIARAHYSLGYAYAQEGRRTEAITQYKSAIKTQSEYHGAHNGLGIAYFNQGKHQQAIAQYLEELKYNPDNPDAHYNLGYAYAYQGRLAEAIAHYQRSPAMRGAHNNLGKIYIRQGKLEQAVAAFLEETKRYPDNIKAQHNLGTAYRDQGRLAEAIAQYKRVLKMWPGNQNTHSSLGTIYFNQGKYQQAIAQYLEELKYNPDNLNAHYNLGYAYTSQGRPAEAIVHYQQSRKIRGAHNNLGKIYIRQGKLEQAVAAFLEETKRYPNNIAAQYNLGNAYRDQGRLTEAITQYKRVLKIDPGFEAASNKLALIYQQQG